ncbi:MAG TPA: CHRD domain-containing protein, partial [Actinomycetota bacterium]|nr:CHRD domain-containing protein [Actinomycetota bacterium]
MRRNIALMAAIAVVSVVGFASVAAGHGEKQAFKATLGGYQEVPVVSTTGTGELRLRLGADGATLEYELTYSGLTGTASAAHLHFGQRGVDGGVAAFLCGGGDKPACPATEGTVTGVIDAADVIG